MKVRKYHLRFGLLCLAAVLLASPGAFGRIKLTTLPVRQRVEIQFDNARATLVEEERIVTLLRGQNLIDFSWSNTAIDKSTIQFRVVDMPTRAKRKDDPVSVVTPSGAVEMIRVINVSYPPGENALVWEVYAEKPFAARVRISYVISNLGRLFNYRAVAEHDESTLTLRKYIRVNNLSGEQFGQSGIWAGFGNYFQREIGLNEAKELLAWKFTEVPITKTYTFDWYTGAPVPDEPEERYVAMRYVLTNDEEHNMGLFPLQRGKVRIFQKDARGGEAFIGEDWGSFTPLDDEMKLYLGLARDIVVKRRILENKRRTVQGNLYHQELVLQYTIENFKTDDVTLDIVENMRRLRDELCGRKDHEPQWSVARDGTTVPKDDMELKDSRTLILHIPLEKAPAGDEKVEAIVATVHVWLRNEW
ncbi:MAG: hypothetical protein ACYTAN_01045 [Planctomycetota bacterium]|jgi:hypothetical protein